MSSSCFASCCCAPTMCYACEPRLATLKMPQIPTRPEPTGPQYFTFDPLPEVEGSPAHKKGSKASRSKKRSRRVLYPPVGKRYYPTEEPSYAKRLLFILLAIVLFQIYSAEEELLPTLPSLSTEENISHCSVELRESHGEPHLLQEPVLAAPSMEILEVVNATGWHWGEDETSESTVDITQLLEQNPAAF
ncbi:radiation-inducible immediate-early gene IEX-1 [Sceloporus undulatus]|uniref:radiation-inducible immediate-early gene IEX-1 n=1 Tax=Sceloporus undulatus TaxID=8520 RepID=UPI001C4D3CC1|nr:radiation-inducible immediate-early gene IEX-1 [Sceloporus undulatus]